MSGRKTNAEKLAAMRARRAEIGDIPAVENPARREACRYNLALFLKTYMPTVFYRDFDEDAQQFIADIQERILHGGCKAIARPRGSGKTALSLGAVDWAALYAHRRYLAFVAATGAAAAQMIADALAYITSEEISADFPEASMPFVCLDGKAQRSRYQTCKGMPTEIEMKRECIVFPTVTLADGSTNDNAGVTIQASGLTGAIRGMHRTDSAKKWIRPDFVLLDDPQTRESAMSPTQTDERERIVNGDVMGLAGHDRKIAAIMACTVIAKHDLSERFLDRKRHPEWAGQRTRMIDAWGGTEEAWRAYDDVYRLELTGAQPRGTASAYYREHRAELEEGAVVMCPALYSEGEESALQHARNFLIEHGEYAFAAECQNEPLSLTPEADYELTARMVAQHLTHRPRGQFDDNAVCLAAGVDINKYAAAWAVVAASGGAVYEVIAYGWWVPRGRRELWGNVGDEAQQVAVMEAVNGVVRDLLRTKPYSAELRVIAVDAGYQAPSVYSACAALAREFRGRRIIPARGLAGDRYSEPSKSISIRCGVLADYRKSRTGNALMMWDSHHWHIVEQRGFLLPVAAEGAVGVFGGDASAHAVFADQVAADKLKRSFVNPYGRTVAVWETNGRNEMGDVVAEALAAISCEGGIAPGMPSSIGQGEEAKEAAALVEAEAKRPKGPTIGNMPPVGVSGRARGWVMRW